METKSYSFSSIRFSDLQKIVSIRLVLDENKFKDWFLSSYKLNRKESIFLKDLIKKHARLLPSYLEEDLKAKFLIPILNQADFMTDTFRDWYDPVFGGLVNDYELKGFVDYMIAKGEIEPQKPYFFIQEFKPSIPDRNPEYQLLAEMLVAIEKNGATVFRGAYIIGQHWKFVILEKIGENQFEYFVSEAFDALKLADLKRIYSILQTVKHKYCVD